MENHFGAISIAHSEQDDNCHLFLLPIFPPRTFLLVNWWFRAQHRRQDDHLLMVPRWRTPPPIWAFSLVKRCGIITMNNELAEMILFFLPFAKNTTVWRRAPNTAECTPKHQWHTQTDRQPHTFLLLSDIRSCQIYSRIKIVSKFSQTGGQPDHACKFYSRTWEVNEKI